MAARASAFRASRTARWVSTFGAAATGLGLRSRRRMAVEDAPVDRADHPATGARVDQPWVGRRDSRADHGVEPKIPPASLPRASRSSRSFPRRRSLRHPSVDSGLVSRPGALSRDIASSAWSTQDFPLDSGEKLELLGTLRIRNCSGGLSRARFLTCRPTKHRSDAQ